MFRILRLKHIMNQRLKHLGLTLQQPRLRNTGQVYWEFIALMLSCRHKHSQMAKRLESRHLWCLFEITNLELLKEWRVVIWAVSSVWVVWTTDISCSTTIISHVIQCWWDMLGLMTTVKSTAYKISKHLNMVMAQCLIWESISQVSLEYRSLSLVKNGANYIRHVEPSKVSHLLK